MSNDPGTCLLHYWSSLVYLVYSSPRGNQYRSFPCRCRFFATWQHYEEIRLENNVGSCVGTSVLFTCLRVTHLKETSFFAFALFALSYVIIIVSYSSILVFFVKERRRKKHLRSGSNSVAVTSQIEGRVAFTLAIVIGIFSACWFPLIISFFATGGHLVKLHGPAFMWIRTLAVSNSAMNFLIYSWRIRDFREAYAKIETN